MAETEAGTEAGTETEAEAETEAETEADDRGGLGERGGWCGLPAAAGLPGLVR